MKKLGLLGKNISHSKSQEMYEEILQNKVDYTLFDCNLESDIPSLEFFFKKIQGLSITTPYKQYFLQNVILSDEIKELNAINCIRKDQEKFYGTNTDYSAILEILNSKKLDLFNKKVILLGDGVMSKVTQIALGNLNFDDYEVFSRKVNGPLENIDLSDEKTPLIIINACSRVFVFNGKLPKSSVFWDLNYNFEPHFHLKDMVSEYIDGLGLLKLQASHALAFWNLPD